MLDPNDYSAVWKRDESLDSLNKRIHDGVPSNQLSERAKNRCHLMFDDFFPYAKPKKLSRVMEFGSGVGWLMQHMLERFPVKEIVGLDISKKHDFKSSTKME